MKLTRACLRMIILEQLSMVRRNHSGWQGWVSEDEEEPEDEDEESPEMISETGELISFSTEKRKREDDGSGSLSSYPDGMRIVVDDPEYFQEYGEPAYDIVGDTEFFPNKNIDRNNMQEGDAENAILNAARSLQSMGIPLSTKVGIIENAGGYFAPDVFGTLKDALSGAGPNTYRWGKPEEDHYFEVLYVDKSAAGKDDIEEWHVPFISLGSVLV